ncbi:MAG: 2Fe-2S iron-sulfur cluster binding domain-containing protein [Aphanocapsa lilacina HA4352-LM1]|jgi:ferredoxin|uniref:Gsr1647 protein n=2 Tax=Gloeobacter TaxID=33071 RepID=Q7NK33_GLOVI|nr:MULTISPECIES: 2Fe-2S iron-sulfur cluster binding domain-containing protein [Gloeobacter]MBW4698997.1 2Fe-2S iron-sulfur cluster binding domain-containing protein [Aphanocapsa lilacina HA4352-LM1]UFP95489.1 2Fe-2S iron-sulfur cluster binding domain-containing protein [Gloeobacter morelensis MG652769]BAC89588.1 gsr1647 [Gloeobacter violaceus PCC 7421]
MAEQSPIRVHFLPDNLSVTAQSGELLLECAERAGVRIPTGCLMGSCHACEVEIDGQGPVCSCITPVRGSGEITVQLYSDPLW